MRELCELLENITEEGYTVLFGQYDGSDELYIRISKKGASIVDSCDHKRMEALGCLPSPEPSKAAEIRIDGMSLSSDLYKSLGKQLSSALACGYLKGENHD